MHYVISLILLDISVNFITFTYKYNPYDKLECFGLDSNDSRIRVNNESESDNVRNIVCMGWNTDIGGAIGHAGGVLTATIAVSNNSTVGQTKLELHSHHKAEK